MKLNMAKHGITIPSRKTLTQAIEHPEKRRAKIADDVSEFLSNGGKIKKVRRGKSGMEFKVFRSRKQVRDANKKFRI